MMQETAGRKNVFFGIMSHEIRSALSGITGMHNLLYETALTSEQRGYVESVRASTETLLTLVNDLVDYSLIEAGELRFDDIEFDLRIAVEEAMETVACRGLEKGSEVHTLIHASVPQTVRGDPARIRQIIVNLGGNALDFSESGEVVLSVRAIEEIADRVAVRFDITGFGIDLSAEQLQRLFQPFSQPETVTAWKYGRTGLGLALSKQLAQLMGGHIGFSSVAGKGSTFWFSVELTKCPPPSQPAGAAAMSLEGMNILIADPSSSGRRVIVHYLEAMGCSCREFEHGEDILMYLAYSTAPPVTYDAMIVALQQVGEAGYQLATKIRNDDLVRSIPLVLVTATGKRGDAQKMKEIGAAAYLTRPLKQHDLIDCMRMIRRANEAATAGAAAGAAAPARRPLITRHTIAEEMAGKRCRILVVDDNAVNRKSIKRYLDKAGYTCEVAENGADAVASFGRREYDLIFMDCQMPIMNGCDAVRSIRNSEARQPGRPPVPVCGMIAGPSKSEREQCIEAGMDDCIVKPFSRDDVIAMVEKWERSASPEPTTPADIN
ncbi:MAG: response regulator [Chitinispirillaceae bacterium]|nr:response regulator [Chitinispirillaceae bacterium]